MTSSKRAMTFVSFIVSLMLLQWSVADNLPLMESILSVVLFMLFFAIFIEVMKSLRRYLFHILLQLDMLCKASKTEESSLCSFRTASRSSRRTSYTGIELVKSCNCKAKLMKRSVLMHLLQTIMMIVQLFVGYILMTAVMYYNAWIFISVIIGSGIGYYFCGVLLQNPFMSDELVKSWDSCCLDDVSSTTDTMYTAKSCNSVEST